MLTAFQETSLQIRMYLLGEEAEAAIFLNDLQDDLPSNLSDTTIGVENDTCVIVITGSQKDGLGAWGKTEENVLNSAKKRLLTFPELGDIGASVIYQAVFTNLAVNTEAEAVNDLVKAKIVEKLEPYSQPISGGRLALLGCSSMRELGQPSFQIILHYLALCEPELEKELNNYLSNYSFFSRDIAFLKAHQNVHKFRVCSSRDNLQQTLDDIDESIQDLFNKSDVLSEDTRLELDVLSSSLSKLLRFYIEVNSTATSTVQQRNIYLHSFDAEPVAVADGQLWHYLRQRINTLNEELEIKISECQAVLQATQQAVAMMQTRIDQADEALEREQEQRLRRRDELLAYLGVAIALPQLIDYDLMETILSSWNIHMLPIGYFSVQVFLIVVIGWFIVDLIKRSSLHYPK